ncbi:MAG: hypothetical protein IJM80_07455, partial [Firmicutes bacterium]|nr:hypothetical protein [Bacillota bacterium]
MLPYKPSISDIILHLCFLKKIMCPISRVFKNLKCPIYRVHFILKGYMRIKNPERLEISRLSGV